MKTTFKYIIGAVILAASGAGIVWAFIEGKAERDMERQREMPIKVPPRLTKTDDGSILVKFDKATQDRAGLRVQALPGKQVALEFVALGRLAEDPAESFDVRAPLAGTLQTAEGAAAWTAIGTRIEPGAALARLLPRLGAVEQVDLRSRLATATAEVQAARAALDSAKISLTRLRALNAQEQNVSDRAVQEADAAVKADEARLAGAQATVDLLEQATKGQLGTGAIPITVLAGGTVVDVTARIGEAVESGQPIVRIARFDRVLATVVLPPGHTSDGLTPGAEVRVALAGSDTAMMRGVVIGEAPTADPKQPGRALLIRVDARTSGARPGMPVTAMVPTGGPARDGVLVPREAIVRHQGRAWVYVQTNGETFARREVALDTPVDGRWFITSLKPTERIVVSGAQVLLSEELKSQIQILEEGAGK